MIGLAGGIASGKSLVAEMLAELGGRVIDSDDLVHEELARAEVVSEFRGWWGDQILDADGVINRRVMADIIFSDASQRSRMEGFLYPRLERRRRELTRSFSANPDVRAIILNSPLLYEFGLDKQCNAVIFVQCDRAARLRRAGSERGWTPAEFDRREKLQNPLDTKRSAADYTVENNSGVDALRSQVKPLFDRLLSDRCLNRDDGAA